MVATKISMQRPIYLALSKARREIRLLHIQPACQYADPLRCELSVAYLDSETIADSPHYEALSYVWGSDKHDKPIHLSGTSMKVTVNLYDALLHLRHKSEERVVWIDALCINQDDLRERTQQIGLMRRIYEKASRTVVWMGACVDDECELAMRYLAQLGFDEQLHLHNTLTPHVQVDGHDIFSTKIQAGLRAFLGNKWWSRMWTVQEWVLSQTVVFQYGAFLLCGQLARQAVRHWRMHFHHLPCCLYLQKSEAEVAELRKLFFGLDAMDYIRLLVHQVSLPYVVSQFRATRRASNPRDMIYGVLGLARNRYEDVVIANYSDSTEEAFEASTLAMIRRTNSLDVLSHLPLSGQRNLQLPSYVPDWTVAADDQYYNDWLNWLGHLHLYNACNSEPAALTSTHPGSICLKGVIFDHVCAVASASSAVSRAAHMAEMLELANTAHDVRGHVSDKDTLSAFWAAMCGTLDLFIDPLRDHRPFYRRIPAPGANALSRFEKWACWELSLCDDAGLTNDSAIRSVLLPNKVMKRGRRFVVTGKGRLAWCPDTCEKGDVVSVLAGGSVPIVLRECAEGRYRVVGDAYVNGVMDGEAVVDMRACGGDWEDIRLV